MRNAYTRPWNTIACACEKPYRMKKKSAQKAPQRLAQRLIVLAIIAKVGLSDRYAISLNQLRKTFTAMVATPALCARTAGLSS